MTFTTLPNISEKEQFAELTGKSIFDGAACKCGDAIESGDLVAANFDVRDVHTGGGLHLLEERN